ncbi:MAG: MFS transporter [Clostridia bacterium]|nr:MFS transporter [Clostridia bacterium]
MNKIMMKEGGKDVYRISRVLYIIEAALEYFIALGISNTYLPTLCGSMGLDNKVVAIVDSFVALGGVFQLGAIFLTDKTPVKPWVTVLHVISEIFFSCMWFVPLFKMSETARYILFFALIISAYVMHDIIQSPKISWFMSLVQEDRRGRFTAIKEIVSLISGLVFTTAFGKLIDYFKDTGRESVAFVLCGCILLAITVGHTLTLIFSKEKPTEKPTEKSDPIKHVVKLFKNKEFLKALVLPVGFNIAIYICNPFYASFQYDKDLGLGLSVTAVSIITAVAAVIRAIFEHPFGKYADKTSFPKMLNLCFIIEGISLLVCVFSVGTGNVIVSVIMCALYWGFQYVAYAGISSGVFNIMFDKVDREDWTSATAVKAAVAGLAGFLATLIGTSFVDILDNAGWTVFGYAIGSQQVLAAIGLVILILLILYNSFVVLKDKKTE